MEWKFDDKKPIYAQIIDHVTERIITGVYPPGERLPGVRELAGEAGVNPNTMQRALAEMERGGLITTNRTAGRCVTSDERIIEEARLESAAALARAYLSGMLALGFTCEDATAMLSELKEEEKNDAGI